MHSIRAKITAATIGAILVCLLVLCGIGYFTIRRESDRSSAEKLELIAQSERKSLDAYLDGLEQSMSAAIYVAQDSLHAGTAALRGPQEDVDAFLADHCEKVRETFASVANHTSGVVTYYYCIDTAVSETEHGFFYSKVGYPGFVKQPPLDARDLDPDDLAHTAWYYDPISAGHAVWVGPYLAHYLGEAWTVSYVTPIYNGSTLIGVLGMDILWETLVDQIDDVTVYDTGYVCLSDEAGRLYYHPTLDMGVVARGVAEAVEPEYFRQQDSGERVIRYELDGRRHQLAFDTLSNGMKLVVVAPVREITASWRQLSLRILLWSAVILAAVTVLMHNAMKAFTGPLQRLTVASRRLAAGDYGVELDYPGQDEVGVLTNSFRQMRDQLHHHISDLNSRAYSDALTGVKNKGAFAISLELLNDAIGLDGGDAPEFALVVFDCNGLKAINDRCGHEQGDAFLRTASAAICRVFAHSPVFRTGGDEFVALLQQQDYAEREALLHQFDDLALETNAAAAHPWERLDLARGLAAFRPGEDKDAEQVLRRADARMYEHKKACKEQTAE